jgi:hypothetical protein
MKRNSNPLLGCFCVYTLACMAVKAQTASPSPSAGKPAIIRAAQNTPSAAVAPPRDMPIPAGTTRLLFTPAQMPALTFGALSNPATAPAIPGLSSAKSVREPTSLGSLMKDRPTSDSLAGSAGALERRKPKPVTDAFQLALSLKGEPVLWETIELTTQEPRLRWLNTSPTLPRLDSLKLE